MLNILDVLFKNLFQYGLNLRREAIFFLKLLTRCIKLLYYTSYLMVYLSLTYWKLYWDSHRYDYERTKFKFLRGLWLQSSQHQLIPSLFTTYLGQYIRINLINIFKNLKAILAAFVNILNILIEPLINFIIVF